VLYFAWTGYTIAVVESVAVAQLLYKHEKDLLRHNDFGYAWPLRRVLGEVTILI
jgi:hypothetical protein